MYYVYVNARVHMYTRRLITRLLTRVESDFLMRHTRQYYIAIGILLHLAVRLNIYIYQLIVYCALWYNIHSRDRFLVVHENEKQKFSAAN